MVLIHKVNEEFKVIGIVAVLWKALSGEINMRIGVEVQFRDVLHGFWSGRGTGTTSLESKLLHQLTAIMDEVLYEVFLGLHKANDALDRESCMDFLIEYEVGPCTESIPWD